MIKKFKNLSQKKLIIIDACLLVVLALTTWLLCMSLQQKDEGYSFINPDKYVEVGNYKNLEYDESALEISEDDITAEIDARRNEAATTQTVTEGEVKNGDVIVIDYVGKIDDKEFEGNKGTDKKITIGSGTFIDGFEDSLVGEKVGETETITVSFPQDYDQKNVAGKTVEYEVTIKSKEETVAPKYDKEFIQTDSKGKYKNKKEYEEYIKNYLIKKESKQLKQRAKNSLWQQVVTDTKVLKYPDKQLEKEKRQILKQHKDLAKEYNVSWEDFLAQYLGTDEEKFKEQLEVTAKASVKEKLTVMAIARNEKIRVTEKEYQESLNQVLKESGLTEAGFEQKYNMSLDEYAEEHDIKNAIVQSKVIDYIFKYAKPAKPAQ